MMDSMMEFIFEKLLPVLIIGGVVLLGVGVVCVLTYDFKGDRANLLVCADKYRNCMKHGGESCMQDVGTCRGDYSTSREEWAKILGDAQTLRQIEAESRTRGSAMTGAMIGSSISGGRR